VIIGRENLKILTVIGPILKAREPLPASGDPNVNIQFPNLYFTPLATAYCYYCCY